MFTVVEPLFLFLTTVKLRLSRKSTCWQMIRVNLNSTKMMTVVVTGKTLVCPAARIELFIRVLQHRIRRVLWELR